ncbi:WW domain-binding protein 1-like [Trinorchestia longiramus]|nr:WW domain-binding protein 1-like [Trinorchestia longiramus]
MGDFSVSLFLFKSSIFVLTLNLVEAHYCEFELCFSEQYCCGDNLCCEYVYSLWYFWVGIVFAVLLVSACVGLFRYHWRHRRADCSILSAHSSEAATSYSGQPSLAAGVSKPLSAHSQYHYQIMTDT